MELSGEQVIAAPRGVVWAGLNDPEVLRQCIPGCEAIEQVSETEMTARVVLRVGPVKAGFAGKVTLSELDPPNAYRISGEGSGGVAGYARGSAAVRLVEQGRGTRLDYTVQAEMGGKIAQLGARLMESTARKLAAEFFEKFGEIVGSPEDAAPIEPAPVAALPPAGWLARFVAWLRRRFSAVPRTG